MEDLVIYNAETKEIYAIIPDCTATEIICRTELGYKSISNSEKYIRVDPENQKVYLVEDENNITYIQDYINKHKR